MNTRLLENFKAFNSTANFSFHILQWMVSIYNNILLIRRAKLSWVLRSSRHEMENNPGKFGAVRTRGPDGKIRTAGVRGISQSDSRI